jgi:hypothetical protein
MMTKQSEIIAILAFPIILAIGIMLIPIVTDYTDHQLAEQAVAQVGRWFLGHIISAVGFSLSIVPVMIVEKHLQKTSRSLPRWTLPILAIGAGFYAAGLGADGIGPIAVQAAGYSPVIFFDGSGMWVTGVFIVGTTLFGIGLLMTVVGSIQQGLMAGRSKYVSLVSALLFMIAPTILSVWALYGVAVAAFGVFVPIAVEIYSKEDGENPSYKTSSAG